MPMMLPRRTGSAAWIRYHEGRKRGRAKAGSHWTEDPEYQTFVWCVVALCSIPTVFFGALLVFGLTLMYGPWVWLGFGVVFLAITALVKGW